MLTLEEVSPTCKYWAQRFSSKKFEFNELFNVAYLIAIKQTTVLTLQKSIRGALLRFMCKRQKFTGQCYDFQANVYQSGSADKSDYLALCSKEHDLQSIIESEELLKIIEEANISQSAEFLDILHLIFVECMTQTEIAKKYIVSPQAISYHYNSIINSLISAKNRRMICQTKI